VGLKAIVVVDNTAAGPAIGGTRMAPDVSVEECIRLARTMTLKNAAAELAHGGAKSVIAGDPTMAHQDKERLVRAFAAAIRNLAEYIPGPDMGTNETAMAWVKNEIGRSVGLPCEIGGIPLDEIGATGFGLAVAAEVAQEVSGIPLRAPGSWYRASGRSAGMWRASWPGRARASSPPPTARAPCLTPTGSISTGWRPTRRRGGASPTWRMPGG
jgi:glutamate dehydrogenase (NAD(P)+)